MSDLIVGDARPRSDFSTEAFHREAAAIQFRFAVLSEIGAITKPKLIKALAAIPGYVYWSDMPLTDGYVPQMIVYYQVPRGKIAIVFPRCGDRMLDDGTITDRHLTIHYIAGACVSDMVALSARVITAMIAIPLAAIKEPDVTDSESCGFAPPA